MQVGDIVHLDGQKAEYSLFGRDRFSTCTLPNGQYIIVGLEDRYVSLAWSESDGGASRKHRYRMEKSAFPPPETDS